MRLSLGVHSFFYTNFSESNSELKINGRLKMQQQQPNAPISIWDESFSYVQIIVHKGFVISGAYADTQSTSKPRVFVLSKLLA